MKTKKIAVLFTAMALAGNSLLCSCAQTAETTAASETTSEETATAAVTTAEETVTEPAETTAIRRQRSKPRITAITKVIRIFSSLRKAWSCPVISRIRSP